MKIRVESRETALGQVIARTLAGTPTSYGMITLVHEPFPLGDVIISTDAPTPEDCVMIERKAIPDLMASIKDGRYDEQSFRLNGCSVPNHNIIYVIEGNPMTTRWRTEQDRHTMYSAIFSLNHYKGFSTYRTFSMEETALVICNMAAKIHREMAKGKVAYALAKPSDGGECRVDESKAERSYVEVAVSKRVKKDNITDDNIHEIMLCQIPGISSVSASAIIKKYGTIGGLIHAIITDPDDICDTYYVNEKGQRRKISRTVSESIIRYLGV